MFRFWILVSAVWVVIVGPFLVPPAAAQTSGYNPYPPGIVPSDTASEVARVEREIEGIFNKTIAEWRALPPPTITGNPPIIQGTGYQAMLILGKLLVYDENLSAGKNQACSACHMPYAGFGGPIPSINATGASYPGSELLRFGKRNPQRYTYATSFPVLHAVHGAFFGGNLWDGGATGFLLQSASADQAQHPFVTEFEEAFSDTACVAFRLSQSVYRPLFEEVWGKELSIRWPADTEAICDNSADQPLRPRIAAPPEVAGNSTPNATPIALSAEDRARANDVYDHVAQSISFFERSRDVTAYSSKFDAFLAGKYKMTPDEMAGYKLFDGKGNCNSCHLDGRSTTLSAEQTDTGATADTTPLFTCFGYANIGLPLNPANAFFYENKPDPSGGYTPNPYGFSWRDLGLGNFLRSGFSTPPNPNGTWVKFAAATDGQFQTMTARDAAMTPIQCPTTEAGQIDKNGKPIPYFQKEFFHNGYIKSLKQLVHFYNTRDVYRYPVTSGHCPKGTTEKVTCWPMPEVPNNIDMTIGNLGLTDHEEDQIVAFLETLTDGYTRPYPDRDTYTGQCKLGGSAATQGNEFLIATPPLPHCTLGICGQPPVPAPHQIP